MFNIADFNNALTNLKRNSKKIITNSFLTSGELASVAGQSNSVFFCNSKSIVIVYEDNHVNRANFYLTSFEDIESLSELLRQVCLRPLIFDCVGRASQVQEFERYFPSIGVKVYTTMSRWRASVIKNLDAMTDSGMFKIAEASDLDAIDQLLTAVFDPYVAHLPTKEKLFALIKDKLAFCAYSESKLVAAALFERIGKTGLYYYQDAVVEEYRATGIGIYLSLYALSYYKDSTTFTSWTEDKNKSSNRMQKFLGYERDGLKNIVFLYE